MSLQRCMHPRNIYKYGIDFKELAILYPEFRKIATTDITGKVHIDFKNEEALRILTTVLLKHDFNLNVKIPPNKLVPTIPLRLNYTLWIEDLLKYASFSDMATVTGIDIGTGAICIYPLMLAKKYGCFMIGTDIDETSIQSSIENVNNNNLGHCIKVVKVEKENILKEMIIDEDRHFHFTMCNPPFFETQGTLDNKVKKKKPPRNAPTGNNEELNVEGGEMSFIAKMIVESIMLGDRVKIYTTMIGNKKSSLYFPKFLKRHGIHNFTWTEFCQGHTKRWGLAWTLLPIDTLDLRKAPSIRESNIPHMFTKRKFLEFQFPVENKCGFVKDYIAKLTKIMTDLQMNMSVLKAYQLKRERTPKWVCKFTAKNDTWTHARRKRRVAERENKDCKKIKLENTAVTEQTNTKSEVGIIERTNVKDEDIQLVFKKDTEISDNKDNFLVFFLFVDVLNDKNDPDKKIVKICLYFESGTGGRNSMERLRQYLINKLDVRVYYREFCSAKWKRKKNNKHKETAKKDPSCELNNAHGEIEEDKEKKVNISAAENDAAKHSGPEDGATDLS
ncbi:hypothetical protein M0802_001085 [Mischocyttarus mexicanus]|nr:hypothetical protein M0802_001085 [Mischocyttarus mexicanus]